MKRRLFPFVLPALATCLLPGVLQATAPVVTVSSAANIGCYSAIPAGTVNANSLETTSYIEFGTDTSYGQRLTTFQSPQSNSSASTVRILATGLTPGTTYHYRVVATNSDGTSTSSDQTFTTDVASNVKTWSSATSSTWTTSARWSPSGVPVSTNDLLFSAAGAYTVTISSATPSPTGRALRVTNGTPTFTWSASFSPSLSAPSSVENASLLITGSSTASFRGLSILNGSVTYTNSNSSSSAQSGVYVGTNGIFTVGTNRTFSSNGTQVDNGGKVIVRGTLSSLDAPHHVLSGGMLTGDGDVASRMLVNDGIVSPDSASGGTAILKVGSATLAPYVQKASGELQLDIGGTTQGTQYDAIKGGGGVIPVTLAGKLTLRFINGFTPAASDEFVIIDNYGSITGTFTTVTGLPDGFGVVYTENNASGNPSVKLKAVASPEIAVEQPSGTDLTDGTASLDFGTATAGHSGTTKTFTIRNSGSTDLTLGSFTVDGTNPGDFTVSTNGMATTVATGSSTTFTVTFNPAAAGARSATLHLANNDLNEASFDLTLTGTATANAVPVAGADTLSRWNTLQVAKVLKSSLLTNDTDADLDTLSITGVGSALPSGATVVLAGNFIVYTAPATNSGAGSFTYTLSDGITTSTGTVTVSEISPPTQDYTANSAAISPSGADFVVTFIGVPGYSYRVQYTTDLSPPYTWNDFSPAADHTAPDNGVFTHTDVAPGSPGRFYRAIQTP